VTPTQNSLSRSSAIAINEEEDDEGEENTVGDVTMDDNIEHHGHKKKKMTKFEEEEEEKKRLQWELIKLTLEPRSTFDEVTTVDDNIERRGGGRGGKSKPGKKKKKKKDPSEADLQVFLEEEKKRRARIREGDFNNVEHYQGGKRHVFPPDTLRPKSPNEKPLPPKEPIETHQGGKKHAPAFVYESTPSSLKSKKLPPNPFLSKPPSDDMPDTDTLSVNFADMPKLRPIASSVPTLRPLSAKIPEMPTPLPFKSKMSAPHPIEERSYPALRLIEGHHELSDRDDVCPKCMKKFKDYVAQHHQNTKGTAIVFVPNKSVMKKLKFASSQQGKSVDYDTLLKSHVAIAGSPNQRTLTTDNGNRIDLQDDNSFFFKERTVKTSNTWSDDLGLKNKVVFHLHGSLLN
jgi:hypothetical protein